MALLVDKILVAQGEGFIHRYIELDVDAGKPGANQALEWMNIVSNGLSAYRKEIQDLEMKLSQAKVALG